MGNVLRIKVFILAFNTDHQQNEFRDSTINCSSILSKIRNWKFQHFGFNKKLWFELILTLFFKCVHVTKEFVNLLQFSYFSAFYLLQFSKASILWSIFCIFMSVFMCEPSSHIFIVTLSILGKFTWRTYSKRFYLWIMYCRLQNSKQMKNFLIK